MNDSAEWATSWLVDLVGPDAPGMIRPVVVHDRHCVGLAPIQLQEQLRELRSPLADGVPKNGRYAVVYERRWNDRDTVWLEAAEYAFGMFGARFVFVQPVRRTLSGALVADGDARELTQDDLAEPSSPALGVSAGATARAVAGSVQAGVRTGFTALRRAGGRSPHSRFVDGPGDESAERAQPAVATERPSLRQRLAGLPTALVVAVWVGVLLLGVVSAVSLTEPGSSSWAAAKTRVSERAAGQTSPLHPAPATRRSAPRPNASSSAAVHGPVPGDLGCRCRYRARPATVATV